MPPGTSERQATASWVTVCPVTESGTESAAEAFDRPTLELLRSQREVDLESSRAAGSTPHRATIWVVVDPADRVFIRSLRGEEGRWYRDVVANPTCVLHLAEREMPVIAVAAADPEQVEACSRALVAKYGNRASTASMLMAETLPTTLRLLPR